MAKYGEKKRSLADASFEALRTLVYQLVQHGAIPAEALARDFDVAAQDGKRDRRRLMMVLAADARIGAARRGR